MSTSLCFSALSNGVAYSVGGEHKVGKFLGREGCCHLTQANGPEVILRGLVNNPTRGQQESTWGYIVKGQEEEGVAGDEIARSSPSRSLSEPSLGLVARICEPPLHLRKASH